VRARALLPGVLLLAGLLAGALPAAAPAATAAATTPARTRTSLPAIERRVMCVTCKIPLMVADSTQADREREYIRSLIAEGRTQAPVESALVGQYGPAVLALPAAHGFDLAAYLVPLAAVVFLAVVLALLLPRWRRRARAQAAMQTNAPALTAAQRARLDADLARFDR
jgi:cytochrome c-type biogenesis protein CcmH